MADAGHPRDHGRPGRHDAQAGVLRARRHAQPRRQARPRRGPRQVRRLGGEVQGRPRGRRQGVQDHLPRRRRGRGGRGRQPAPDGLQGHAGRRRDAHLGRCRRAARPRGLQRGARLRDVLQLRAAPAAATSTRRSGTCGATSRARSSPSSRRPAAPGSGWTAAASRCCRRTRRTAPRSSRWTLAAINTLVTAGYDPGLRRGRRDQRRPHAASSTPGSTASSSRHPAPSRSPTRRRRRREAMPASGSSLPASPARPRHRSLPSWECQSGRYAASRCPLLTASVRSWPPSDLVCRLARFQTCVSWRRRLPRAMTSCVPSGPVRSCALPATMTTRLPTTVSAD